MENLVMRDKLSSYYSGKKIFVTGHTGFKGSWLIACLHYLGANVKGYSLAPEFQNGLFNLLQPFRIGESVIADVRDRNHLQEEIIQFDPDYIFHLAAQPLVRRSYSLPAETFEVNAIGTANVLEAVANLGRKCVVIVVTTDKVYQNKEQDVLYVEDDSLGGFDPYSASKACAELIVSSFRSSFFNTAAYPNHQKCIASARAGNVIGGGDWNEDRIFPDIVRFLQQDKPIPVRNPGAVRPWQHVLEPIAGYLLLGGLLYEGGPRYSSAYNFGPVPDDHLTVKELVKIAIKYWGSGDWVDISDRTQLHEAGLLKLDINRAQRELGWSPKLSAELAIKWTIDWYRQPLAEQAEYAFTQIKDYFQL
jgi:CDP-glucose 4,6-dehydratase